MQFSTSRCRCAQVLQWRYIWWHAAIIWNSFIILTTVVLLSCVAFSAHLLSLPPAPDSWPSIYSVSTTPAPVCPVTASSVSISPLSISPEPVSTAVYKKCRKCTCIYTINDEKYLYNYTIKVKSPRFQPWASWSKSLPSVSRSELVRRCDKHKRSFCILRYTCSKYMPR